MYFDRFVLPKDVMSDATPANSLLGEILRQVKYYAVALVAAGIAVVGLFAFGEELRNKYDFTQPRVILFAGITLLVILFGVALPVWRERRRRAWLVKIGEDHRRASKPRI